MNTEHVWYVHYKNEHGTKRTARFEDRQQAEHLASLVNGNIVYEHNGVTVYSELFD